MSATFTLAVVGCCVAGAIVAAFLAGREVGRHQADLAEHDFSDLRDPAPDLDTIPLAACRDLSLGELVRGYGGLPRPVRVYGRERTTDVIAGFVSSTDDYIERMRNALPDWPADERRVDRAGRDDHRDRRGEDHRVRPDSCHRHQRRVHVRESGEPQDPACHLPGD